MLIGVARRQEREKHLVVPTKIARDDVGAALDIVKERPVVLLHSARRTARSAGIDDACEIIAADALKLAFERLDVAVGRGKLLPGMTADPIRSLHRAKRLHRNDVM